MNPIIDLPADLPPHDPAPLAPVPSRVVAEWPAGVFVENLCPLADGSFAVSVLSEARLDRVWPDGRHEVLARLPAPPTGLVRTGGTLFVCVGVPDEGPASLYALDLASGTAERLFAVEGATFLNGMTALSHTVLLAAEAAQGRIIRLDLRARSADTWRAHELLTRAPQAPFLPGANGIKIFGRHVTITSNGRALLLRAAILADASAGQPEVVAERLRGDDMAFGADGSLFVATHIGHSLDRIAPGGTRVTLAGPDEGLAGSTACAFGITGADREALYVTTTGGIIGPVDGQLQPARLVRLEVGVTGHPLVPSDQGDL